MNQLSHRVHVRGEFVQCLRKAQRVLVVRALSPKSPAAASLAKGGLRPGMEIEQIDDIAADELDEWQVEQRLAGAYGQAVKLSWRTRAGMKSAAVATAP